MSKTFWPVRYQSAFWQADLSDRRKRKIYDGESGGHNKKPMKKRTRFR